MATFGPRPHAGGSVRVLDEATLKARRETLRALPPSTERSRGLLKVKRQLQQLKRRSERNG